MKFQLIVRESKIINVDIDADNLDKAINLAKENYSNGQYDFLINNGEYEEVEVFQE